MAKENMDMDQDIPAMREWVEERVRHHMESLGRRGDAKIIRHPNQDFQGVLVSVRIEGQSKPEKLPVIQETWKFDQSSADRQIRHFVQTRLPSQ